MNEVCKEKASSQSYFGMHAAGVLSINIKLTFHNFILHSMLVDQQEI